MSINNIYEGFSKTFSYINMFNGPLRPHFIRPALNSEVNNNLIRSLGNSFKTGIGLDSTTHIAGAFNKFKFSGSLGKEYRVLDLKNELKYLEDLNKFVSERVHHSVSFLPPKISNFGLGFIKDNPTFWKDMVDEAIEAGAEPSLFSERIGLRVFFLTASAAFKQLAVTLGDGIITISLNGTFYNTVPDLTQNVDISVPLKQCPSLLIEQTLSKQFVAVTPFDIPIECLRGVSVDNLNDVFLEDSFNNKLNSQRQFFDNSRNIEFYDSDYFFKNVCEIKAIKSFSLENFKV